MVSPDLRRRVDTVGMDSEVTQVHSLGRDNHFSSNELMTAGY